MLSPWPIDTGKHHRPPAIGHIRAPPSMPGSPDRAAATRKSLNHTPDAKRGGLGHPLPPAVSAAASRSPESCRSPYIYRRLACIATCPPHTERLPIAPLRCRRLRPKPPWKHADPSTLAPKRPPSPGTPQATCLRCVLPPGTLHPLSVGDSATGPEPPPRKPVLKGASTNKIRRIFVRWSQSFF